MVVVVTADEVGSGGKWVMDVCETQLPVVMVVFLPSILVTITSASKMS